MLAYIHLIWNRKNMYFTETDKSHHFLANTVMVDK